MEYKPRLNQLIEKKERRSDKSQRNESIGPSRLCRSLPNYTTRIILPV